MTAPELYHEAARLGLRLEPRGDKLAVIPGDRVPPDFANTLREHKADLLEWLLRPPCPGFKAVPPTTLPLNPEAPSPSVADRERMIGFLLRQGCDRPGELTRWLEQREKAYYDGAGRKWDCGLHAYVAARDAACWQLNRSESEVLTLLESFEHQTV